VISNRSTKWELRKIKKNDLDFKITSKESQFYEFYHNMYLPYMIERHGNRNKCLSYSRLMEYWESGNCELMLIKNEKKYIAGQVIVYDNGRARLSLFGIKDGKECYLKSGAGAAGYHFSARYLEYQGHRKIHVGGSRAFLRDGVLQYKKKLGLRLVGRSREGFLIKVLSLSSGVKEFFLRNPFIFVDRGRTHGAIFVERLEDCSSAKSLEEFCKSFYTQGMSNLIIYPLNLGKDDHKIIFPTTVSNKATIVPADHLSGPALE
jgi:hypothetical protein